MVIAKVTDTSVPPRLFWGRISSGACSRRYHTNKRRVLTMRRHQMLKLIVVIVVRAFINPDLCLQCVVQQIIFNIKLAYRAQHCGRYETSNSKVTINEIKIIR
ncbi:hypothetical protein AVEN_170676-1 [Araneus ventricosus]|uniref:Uncharacterized protein n=1 Tax=Araneus ventricosus TaxID=182803 RepID=A0A4Y2SD68_ARAVE|nr:hypothetical protein AVEN_170676-1 [Araneus ventricosus]